MKTQALLLGLSLFLFSCNEEKKVEEKNEQDGIHMSISDSNEHAEVDINGNGIHVKANDGKEADVSITPEGIDITTKEGEEAKVKINANGMDIKTNEGDASVKMDQQGNMKIKSSDGKEIEVTVKDPNKK